MPFVESAMRDAVQFVPRERRPELDLRDEGLFGAAAAPEPPREVAQRLDAAALVRRQGALQGALGRRQRADHAGGLEPPAGAGAERAEDDAEPEEVGEPVGTEDRFAERSSGRVDRPAVRPNERAEASLPTAGSPTGCQVGQEASIR
jgi:hypothetical protein